MDSDFTMKPWLDIEYITEEMEGPECTNGGKTWNLMLYPRAPLKFVGLGDFRCLGLMRKGREEKRRSGGGSGGVEEEEGRVSKKEYF